VFHQFRVFVCGMEGSRNVKLLAVVIFHGPMETLLKLLAD
jgi:hypothetical protein